MKKILTIIFITITVLSLTGCTNNDGGESVQKVSFEELEDLHELLKDMPIRDTMEFAFYKELDATQIGETNLFEYTKKDKPKKEVSFTKADDLFKFLGKLREDYTPYRIKLESDMNIDCTKFNFTNEAGYAGTLNAGVLVIPEGKTITISGRSANDMAIIFPMIVLEKNSKIILENNANLVSDIFLAKQGSSVELKYGRLEVQTLINYGTIKSSHKKSHLRVLDHTFYEKMPNFFNSTSGIINIDGGNAEISLNNNNKGGQYISPDYGLKNEVRPIAMNYGKIITGASGQLKFDNSLLNKGNTPLDKLPVVNAGNITIGTNNLEEWYGFIINGCHFQNYGEINLNGAQNKNTQRSLVNILEETFENYGTINVNTQYLVAISGSNNYFINYENAKINDKTGKNSTIFGPKEENDTRNYFFNNVSRSGEIKEGEVNRGLELAIKPYKKLFESKYIDSKNKEVTENIISFTTNQEKTKYTFKVFGSEVYIDNDNYANPPIELFPEFENGTFFTFSTQLITKKYPNGVDADINLIVRKDGKVVEYTINDLDGNTITSGEASLTKN